MILRSKELLSSAVWLLQVEFKELSGELEAQVQIEGTRPSCRYCHLHSASASCPGDGLIHQLPTDASAPLFLRHIQFYQLGYNSVGVQGQSIGGEDIPHQLATSLRHKKVRPFILNETREVRIESNVHRLVARSECTEEAKHSVGVRQPADADIHLVQVVTPLIL